MSHRGVSMLFRIGMILCFVVVLTSAHAEEGKPVASTETDSYDFGEVFAGADVLHDFIVKNTGDADLEIQSVNAG